MKLEIGDAVTLIVHGAGYVTEEEAEVTKISENGDVFLNDDDSNPYVDGKRKGSFGFWFEIKELKVRS